MFTSVPSQLDLSWIPEATRPGIKSGSLTLRPSKILNNDNNHGLGRLQDSVIRHCAESPGNSVLTRQKLGSLFKFGDQVCGPKVLRK